MRLISWWRVIYSLSGGYCGGNKQYFTDMCLTLTPLIYQAVIPILAVISREITVDPS